MEPASCSIGPGIRADDDFLQNNNCHMQMLDHGLNNVDLFAKGSPYYEKYQKLLPREKLTFQALIRRAFTNKCFKTEFLAVIHQLKALNDFYSTEIPLLLVSNYYNDDFVQMVARDYSDKKLSIHIIKQPLFPLVEKIAYDPGEIFDPSESDVPDNKDDPFKIDNGSTLESQLMMQPKHYYFCVARREINKEHMYMPPHKVPRPDWYNPGEVFTLFEQVKRHFTANEKEYILVLNSGMDNVVDLRILNYLCEPRDGPNIDVCFEVIKPRVSDLSIGCEVLVKSGERLRVLPHNSLDEARYDINTDGLILTKNIWISIPFLRNEESCSTLLKIALAKEVAVGGDGKKSEIRLEMTLDDLIEARHAVCAAVEVPAERLSPTGPLRWLWEKMHPTWAQKIKLKTVLTYCIWSMCYHAAIFVMTAGLHERYLKSDESEEDVDRLGIQKREERELNIFWIENAVWLVIFAIYFLVLTSRRLKNANKSRSPRQRQSRACADFAQALLLGTTRFLYAGLNKTAEVKKWFGGNAWLYLLPLHFLSSILEVAGSLLIMYLIEAPEVMEPLETS
ncbi:hypothetical protein ACQ4PT_030985 [Festuca glaucescens]